MERRACFAAIMVNQTKSNSVKLTFYLYIFQRMLSYMSVKLNGIVKIICARQEFAKTPPAMQYLSIAHNSIINR